ncbi:GNAT family N-acetyltransferase [Viridibacterium curvum]|uniref:N-acetyltransferase domain-containing protein n=1 Tax=Viridibacterium curvum TaxID=1101404 RepID=A0ABP9Q8L1_9RHOO
MTQPSTQALSLRPVREDELPLLGTLLAELDGTPPLPLERLQATWRAIHRYPDYQCYFAERDGEVIGSLSMIVFPVFAHDLASEAIIEAVVIRPAFRGIGLGREMIRAAMQIAAQRGAYKLALSSNLRRLDAHRFYDGMGFARHGYSFHIDTRAEALAE